MAKNLKNQSVFDSIRNFSATQVTLAGVSSDAALWTLVQQIEESRRRISFLDTISRRGIDPASTDPANQAFDPIKAAISFRELGEFDDACWMVFLATYFGRHLAHKWLLCAEVYSGNGSERWIWSRINTSLPEFEAWVDEYRSNLKPKRSSTGFGNHRKYESLKRTADAVKSYLSWVGESHEELFSQFELRSSNSGQIFETAYNNLDKVLSFGRTGKFDYLILLARLKLFNGHPSKPYLLGATGPLIGSKLLVTGKIKSRDSALAIESIISKLSVETSIGCDILEDAICNWQKSPTKFVQFRG